VPSVNLTHATESPKLRQEKPRRVISIRNCYTLRFTMARQRLGQHFLTDPAWRARILATLGLHTGDTWVEIGAGHGEMTHDLAGRVGRVIAIETDPRLVEELRHRAREWPNVEVVHGDVLALDLAQLAGNCFRVYGNLPYYITSPILHHLFREPDRIGSIHIVVQFEVAARIVARPGRRAYGYLSAASQFYTRPEIVLRIPPGAFRPRPKVTSALLAMRLPGERDRLRIENETEFLKFVQACFGQKRKTLRNNLRAVLSGEQVEAALSSSNLPGGARAEQLTLAQFAELFRRLRTM
jgi:16S rRNA (adenine1518-N6/adenine1519-N6)-dimethyltransferase